MQRGRPFNDYEPVTRSSWRPPRLAEDDESASDWQPSKPRPQREEGSPEATAEDSQTLEPRAEERTVGPKQAQSRFRLKRGHALTYAALFLFTVVLYARPAEFYPSPLTASLAFYLGVLVLVCYLPSQLSIEGTLTARPKEVNLVLLFCLMGLLSMPLAYEPAEALDTFSDTFIRCIFIFIVMVNVVRTETRLKGLLFLTLLVSCWLSLGALDDFWSGRTVVEGYRVAGRGSGIFGNSNDMAMHLVTILPIAIALFFGSRSRARKICYILAAALMIGAIVVTYSRGGFLGLLCVLGVLAWKLGRKHRMGIVVTALALLALIILFAPGNYSVRLLSIFVPSLDPVGSSDMRQQLLWRSILVALRHPFVGIGMGNFHIVSYNELASHNAYTQVASEMGAFALYCYVAFIVSPLRRLRQVERETFEARERSRFYYLSVGLQAALVGYMVTSFFASVAYLWYVYYLVAYAVCLRRLYESETGSPVLLEKERVKALERERRHGVEDGPTLAGETLGGTVTT